MVTGIDQVGLPIALERGFFEKHGLDVTIARPYATGVDALNALQAGESEIVQVGVPMIGAVLRGMDLVALGNYSGNATKLGSDATVALVAREGSGIDKNNLATLKGKKIAASFGTINHLYALALHREGGPHAGRRDARQHAAARHDGRAAVEGHRRVLGLGPVAHRRAEGRSRRLRRHPRRRRDLLPRLQRRHARLGREERRRRSRSSSPPSSEADKWMRANPKQAAQVATRWIPGLKPEVAEAAMQFNIQQNDRRLSANNYRALWAAQDRLSRLGIIKSTFDVNKHIEPKYILKVMTDKPELFSDLPPIPADVAIEAGLRLQALRWRHAARRVLVTGATSGIGAGIARAFAAAGDAVVATGATEAEVEAARGTPGIDVRRLDVRDGEAVARAGRRARRARRRRQLRRRHPPRRRARPGRLRRDGGHQPHRHDAGLQRRAARA